MDAQVAYVRQRLQGYLARIVELSIAVPPPGKNAANGWFREYMVTDNAILRAGDPPTLPLDGEAKDLFEIYTFFYSNVQRAFRSNGNHYADWRSGEVTWKNLKKLAGEIARVGFAIIGLMSGDESLKDAAKARLAQSIEAVIRKINNSGTVWQGAHANGWISVYAQSAGSWTIGELDKRFPRATDSDSGRVADILRALCEGVLRLKTAGHSPWLRPEWQLSFQALCEASVAALASEPARY